MVCRNTGLSDENHIEFSRYFGELDDIRPYIDAGRISRLPYPELFDAGNIDPISGDVAPLSAAQVVGNKVKILQRFPCPVGNSTMHRQTSNSMSIHHSTPGEQGTLCCCLTSSHQKVQEVRLR